MNLFGVLSEVYPTLLTGLTMTVKITILSLIIALVIGIFVCLMNISSNIVLRGIAKFYIWLIRGTPMLVQAFYFYFALPQLVQAVTGSQFRITVFTASLVTLARMQALIFLRFSEVLLSPLIKDRWKRQGVLV